MCNNKEKIKIIHCIHVFVGLLKDHFLKKMVCKLALFFFSEICTVNCKQRAEKQNS